jgi:hypothetical protein
VKNHRGGEYRVMQHTFFPLRGGVGLRADGEGPDRRPHAAPMGRSPTVEMSTAAHAARIRLLASPRASQSCVCVCVCAVRCNTSQSVSQSVLLHCSSLFLHLQSTPHTRHSHPLAPKTALAHTSTCISTNTSNQQSFSSTPSQRGFTARCVAHGGT